MGLIGGNSLIVLFDSGATHSFIAYDCVRRLGLPTTKLPYDLYVSTPTEGTVMTSSFCLGRNIIVQNKPFIVDLICLTLINLDIILGMDWLSANHVMVNCFDKTICFPLEYPEKQMSNSVHFANAT